MRGRGGSQEAHAARCAALVLLLFSSSGDLEAAGVRVSGVIEREAGAQPVLLQLAPRLSRYERLAGMADGTFETPSGTPVQVQANGGFAFEAPEPGVWRLLVGTRDGWFGGFGLTGPETDMRLRPSGIRSRHACRLVLEAPALAWVDGRPLDRRSGGPKVWERWRPWVRLERARAWTYRFDASQGRAKVVVGAPGREPMTYMCEPGREVAVRLPFRPGAPVDVVLERGGEPLTAAVLVAEDGWPECMTDDLGRCRARRASYSVVTADHAEIGIRVREAGRYEVPLPVAAGPAVEVRVRSGRAGSAPSSAAAHIAHWFANGQLLGSDVVKFVAAGSGAESLRVVRHPDAVRTTVMAFGYETLSIDWENPPSDPGLSPLRSIEGTVVDRDGVGIADAEVLVSAGDPDGARRQARTTEQGGFVVHLPGSRRQAGFAASATGFRSQGLRVDPLKSPVALELARPTGLTGRVVSPRGEGLRGSAAIVRSAAQPGAGLLVGAVECWWEPSRAWPAGGASVLELVAADDRGAFVFADVRPGRNQWLVVSAPGYTPTWRAIESAGSEPLDVGDVIVEPGLSLGGVVTDEGGRPIAGAELSFARSQRSRSGPGGRSLRPVASTVSDETGRFEIDGLSDGDLLDLGVQAGGYVYRELPRVRIDQASAAAPFDIELETGVELHVHLTDESTGESVEEALVRFVPEGGGASALQQSAPDGKFVLRGVPDRAGVLRVDARAYEAVHRRLEARPRQPIEIALSRGGATVEGVVVRNGAPVVGARIQVARREAHADASGRFVLQAPAGDARLDVWLPSASAWVLERWLQLEPGVNEVVVDLTPVVLSGRAQREDGSPFGETMVTANPGPFGPSTVSDEEGRFELEVFPGRQSVVVYPGPDGGVGLGTEEIVVEAGDRPYVVVTVRDRERAGLRVHVLGLTLAEENELQVHAGRWSLQRAGQEAGAIFEGSGMRSGAVTVVAAVSSSGRERRRTVELDSGTVTEVEIAFDGEKDGKIEGLVTVDGGPWAGEAVLVFDAQRPAPWTVWTDHRGAFTVDGLEKGAEVRVAAVGQSKTVRVRGETAKRLDFDVLTASLRGRLISESTGVPAANLEVSAAPANVPAETARHHGLMRTTRTAEDGSFAMSGLFRAPYRLVVGEPRRGLSTGAELGAASVDLGAGEVDVTLAVRDP